MWNTLNRVVFGKNSNIKLQLSIWDGGIYLFGLLSLHFCITPLPSPFLCWSFSSLCTRGAGAEWAALTHCSSSKWKWNMSIFMSNWESGLVLHSSLVGIYIHRNDEHLNRESKRECLGFLLPREVLVDPVFTKGLYEWLKANGFMSSHVQQPHDVVTQQRTIQQARSKRKGLYWNLESYYVTLLCITQTPGKPAGKNISFLKMENSPPLKMRSEKVPTALPYNSRYSQKG